MALIPSSHRVQIATEKVFNCLTSTLMYSSVLSPGEDVDLHVFFCPVRQSGNNDYIPRCTVVPKVGKVLTFPRDSGWGL